MRISHLDKSVIGFRFIFLLSVLAAAAFAGGQDHAAKSPAPSDSATITPRARAIHDSAIVVDTHADTPQRFLDENFDIGSTDPNDLRHISLQEPSRRNLRCEFLFLLVLPQLN